MMRGSAERSRKLLTAVIRMDEERRDWSPGGDRSGGSCPRTAGVRHREEGSGLVRFQGKPSGAR